MALTHNRTEQVSIAQYRSRLLSSPIPCGGNWQRPECSFLAFSVNLRFTTNPAPVDPSNGTPVVSATWCPPGSIAAWFRHHVLLLFRTIRRAWFPRCCRSLRCFVGSHREFVVSLLPSKRLRPGATWAGRTPNFSACRNHRFREAFWAHGFDPSSRSEWVSLISSPSIPSCH